MNKKIISMVCAFALIFCVMAPTVSAQEAGSMITIDGSFGEWQNIRKTVVTWWDSDWEGSPSNPAGDIWDDDWWDDDWWDDDDYDGDNNNYKDQKYLCAMMRDSQNIYLYVGQIKKNKGNNTSQEIPYKNYQFYINKKHETPIIQIGKLSGAKVEPLNKFPAINQGGVYNYVTTTQEWMNNVPGLNNGGRPNMGKASLKNASEKMFASNKYTFDVVSQLEFSISIADFEKYLKLTSGTIDRGAMVAMFNSEMGGPALVMAGTSSGAAIGLSLSAVAVSAGFIINKKRNKNKKKEDEQENEE